MRGLIYSARPISGREGKIVIRHMNIIGQTCDEVDILSTTKTDGAKIALSRYGNVEVDNYYNHYGHYYETLVPLMSSWMEVYNSIDVTPLQQYDKLFIVGGMDLWRSELTRVGKRSGVFPNDGGQIKFQSVGAHCTNILAILKAHNLYNIPLHEIAIDPNEISCGLFHEDVRPTTDYYLYHGYDIPAYGINRLDSLQAYLLTKPTPMITRDKITDFTFGLTILEKSNREEFMGDIEDIMAKFQIVNFYIKDYRNGQNTLIDPDAYMNKIEESRFTYMLPSYDRHCFSIYRFIEAINYDCLPLINSACNLVDIQNSFDVDLSPLVTTDIPTESRRLELLEYVQDKIMLVEKSFKND